MRLTLRLVNEQYLDIYIDIHERKLLFINAIPDISRNDLQELANKYYFKLYLPITEEVIEPVLIPKPKDLSTKKLLATLLTLVNNIVTEY